MTALDGQEPVRRAAAGDREALASLWRENRRWVAGVLLANLPAGAELDDLLQDVATALIQHIGELREPGKFRPWLRSVALNVAASAGRKVEVRRRALRPLGDHEPAATETDGAAAEVGRVLELARRLPVEYREPLLLRCVHGQSQRAIAEALELPETTVETRLARARRMLREELERARAREGLTLPFPPPRSQPAEASLPPT